MRPVQRKRNQALSLLELVVVIVIIGIIAVIAIPRVSRGAAGGSDSALIGDLAVMRNAIDLYAEEHNGSYPTVAAFSNQLTRYSDISGAVNADGSKDSTHIYGPYLRKVPPLPTGTYTNSINVAAPAAVPPEAVVASGSVGWLYDAATGQVWANDVNNLDK